MGKLVCVSYIESERHTTLWQLYNTCAPEQCNGNINTFQWNSQFQYIKCVESKRKNEWTSNSNNNSTLNCLSIKYAFYICDWVKSTDSHRNWYELRDLIPSICCDYCAIFFYIGVFNITFVVKYLSFSFLCRGHLFHWLPWMNLLLRSDFVHWKRNQL